MNHSKQKSPNLHMYSDYFIQNNYFITNQSQHVQHYKTHQRKSSQVSTRSCKSKLRNLSSVDKNQSQIKPSPHIIMSTKNVTLKTSKTDEKKSILRKQFSLDRMRVLPNKSKAPLTTTRKQKLKIQTDRKQKLKLIQSITTRYIKYEKQKSIINKNIVKTDKSTSHSSFLNKIQQLQEKIKAQKKKNETIKGFQERNIEQILTRCENVLTEYYQKIVSLRKENQLLREQNMMLKSQNAMI